MNSPPEYVLTRDYLDNNRINLQHHLWIRLFGYLIHPKISTENPNLRIADVGTGTGIWLTDLAKSLPESVQLDGLDVSFDAAPPSEWLPSNLTLRQWDVKKDVPEELVGVYDIVHIRNFLFVLQNHEVLHVLGNLVRMIKPGGYLQWAEPDVASFRIEKTKPENPTNAMNRLLKVSQGQDARLSPTWVPNLPVLYKEIGLEDITSDVKIAPPYHELAFHECSMIIHELFARTTKKQGMAEQLRELLPEVAKETRQGSCWAFTRMTVVGKKSL
ncbi:hypothetical protein BCON_0003g00290 [Botryotinia convoluta]|uniref:Methyltransferase domain-containing protein n=1 Tax=Botryotinia convoluta TaxID=54673 RepID=A0A4Z1IV58_9HELO|nr:hypothetical protein BCON_0003g00290 [Botryotinia convoluta]